MLNLKLSLYLSMLICIILDLLLKFSDLCKTHLSAILKIIREGYLEDILADLMK